MSLKQMSVKQAEKWLEKLKSQNLQSYKDITKFLRKYEKNEDEHDCYVKISHSLLSHAELTKELNTFLEEGNKLVVNRPQDEKIKELMAYIKKNRPEIFEKIIKMIQELSKTQGDNPFEICQSLKPRLKEIISGDPALQRITEEALDLTGEELINRKHLEHLKIYRHSVPVVEQEKDKDISKPPPSKSQPQRQIVKNEEKVETNRRQPIPKITNKPLLLNFTNPSEEKVILKHLQKSLDKQLYLYIIKLIKIYHLNIITRNEVFELLSKVQMDENYMECLKDMLDARETERRKTSLFKPLNDMNFSNCERPSPSYVSMSPYYPIRCSGKSEAIKALTNQKWVSVPHGSQENENFSVRNKNSNQLNLLKAEDQRYEFDIYMRRLTKTLSMLDEVLDEKSTKTEAEKFQLVSKVIQMGVLQLLYKNGSKEQKQQFECFLGTNNLETCKIFRDKIAFQIGELKGIKDIHANKNWNEVATKNFYKALDLKGFEFKKNEKERLKSSYFMMQLQERLKILQNGGQLKNQISFDDKKEFFSILNSFESSSRSQRCITRNLPLFEYYDMSDESRRHFYPIMILAFQEDPICQQLYSLSLFFIDSIQMNETERTKCKKFLNQFLGDYLGWKKPAKRVVSEAFNQQKLYQKIASDIDEDIDINEWLKEQKEQSPPQGNFEFQLKLGKKMKFINDVASVYSYLPVKSSEKLVFYGSEHLYNLLRFIYTIYERIIKMREVIEDEKKLDLFWLLFYACIKTRQGIKFEENLNLIFGKYAYLFSTIYKLFDSMVKTLSSASSCQLTNFSLKNCGEQSQDAYYVLLNRFCLINNLVNSKILRFTYNINSKVIYLNYMDSYYKSEESGKELIKKRSDINMEIDIYTSEYLKHEKLSKKIKPNEMLKNNELQYTFEGSTIKMIGHKQKEDLFINKGSKPSQLKVIKRDFKRANKLLHLFV